ncbi:MAG: tRNA uridine-5-carboxymethylaminomethyl(34) synthesis enzyme MnmG, partial [Acidobacteria bacterium]|nr:tRNA uridine-5-carboxymethylaminomethyl(34) synthesis enzyme MnmG [Acidobacteriota bacterium]
LDKVLPAPAAAGENPGASSFSAARRRGQSLLVLLRRPGIGAGQVLPHLRAAGGRIPSLDRRDLRLLEARVKYAGYVRRQLREVRHLARDERRRIPAGFDYERVGPLSREVTEKLTRVRPENLGQAGRISGVTPAALAALRVALRRRGKGEIESAGSGSAPA